MAAWARFVGALAVCATACTPDGRDLSPLLDAGGGAPDASPPTVDGGADPIDAGVDPVDAGVDPDAGHPDSGRPPPPPLGEVGHRRELRGVWIATVSNINFPSRTGLSAAEMQAELRAIVDATAAHRLNAILFQVRPESDALYASTLEPWSRYLTGTQGQDPGFDPLAYLIEQAHAQAIEVHAWMNPYRAKANANSTAAPTHVSNTLAAHGHRYGSFLWMDPGAAPVQAHLLNVISDLLDRYDVDGLHFDDYFYPYPDDTDFPDDATWSAYQAQGGALSRDDWRRDNVNTMVEAVAQVVLQEHPDVRFGISPFGIYRPGIPEGIVGLDQYAAIFADPPHWMDQGWVDYLAPQLYWPSTQTRQAYGPLVAWWASIARDGRTIVPGNFLSRLGDSSSWSVDEFRTQVELTRAEPADQVAGNVYFTIEPLMEDRDGISGVFQDELYPRPALPPPLPGRAAAAPAPPTVSAGPAFAHAGGADRFVVYRAVDGAWRTHAVLAPGAPPPALEAGDYAVTAADQGARESDPVAFTVP